MKSILHIVGARPQFVKLAPFFHVLQSEYEQGIIHTGQHYDAEMSDFFFRDLDIPAPNHNLNIGSGKQGAQTGQMLIELERVLECESPDLVIIYGDTNSTLAGALVSAKLGLPSIHVEAGLRSFNRSMPEEINRIVADHTCDYLFAPTQTAMDNLYGEGLLSKAFNTGDIMVDSIKEAVMRAERSSHILSELCLTPDTYNLLTLHRPYNVDNPDKLLFILSELNKLDEQVIFPVHPRTLSILNQQRDNFFSLSNIRYINPQGYLDFVLLENHCKRILTDSGGIQKEAYVLKKPCVTLRTETEWVETVSEGWNLLLPPETESFHRQILTFQMPTSQNNVFGTDVAHKMRQLVDKLMQK